MAVGCAVALSLVGCSSDSGLDGNAPVPLPFLRNLPPVPPINAPVADQGRIAYDAVCASCHGAKLEGAENWRTPDSAGVYRPPPLDAAGHAWHHSTALLTSIIHDGIQAEESLMVGFASRLSDEGIASVVEYLKSTWGYEQLAFQWAVDHGPGD
jgi:mono/diheme cytochrome c family protein